MDLLDDMRQETAVFWAVTGVDEYNRPTFDYPRELRVRWEDTNEVVTKPSGETFTSRSKVYVGEDLARVTDRWGVFWYGTLESLPAANRGNPFSNSGAYEIQRFDRTPTIDADDFVRVAWL